MYDVGNIARTLQDEFALFVRPGEPPRANTATAGHLRELVATLEVFTEELFLQRMQGASLLGADADDDRWDAAFASWNNRLQAYDDALQGVPDDDRKVVLWSVTAPLLLGLYGGELNKGVRKPMDAVTPFSLANQLDVAEAWREERWARLLDDLADNAADVVDVVTPSLPVAALAAAAAALVLLFKYRGRR